MNITVYLGANAGNDPALKKAVRNPIIALKSIEDEEKRAHYADVLGELFQLNETRK